MTKFELIPNSDDPHDDSERVLVVDGMEVGWVYKNRKGQVFVAPRVLPHRPEGSVIDSEGSGFRFIPPAAKISTSGLNVNQIEALAFLGKTDPLFANVEIDHEGTL